MNIELPNDLLAFLRAGSQLRYDVKGSEIGGITLKRDVDLALTTIATFPGCQSIVDDPYETLEGLYQIDVVDLVAEAEYCIEGLLCWIVALQRFGSIDPEHGDVITFPGAAWTDLVASPLRYLDAQWNHDLGERVLPWLHFPFKLSEVEVLLAPYGTQCPVHGIRLAAGETQKPHLLDIMRRRELEDWLQQCQSAFPCGGVPLSEEALLSCPACRAAEDAWVQRIADAIAPIDAQPNAAGAVQCPACGWRFRPTDANVFLEGIHLLCGQKINVIS